MLKKLALLALLLIAAAPAPTGSLNGVTPVEADFPVIEGMTGHVVFDFETTLKKQDPALIEVVCNESFRYVGRAEEVFAVQVGSCEATLFFYDWTGHRQEGPFVLDALSFEA